MNVKTTFVIVQVLKRRETGGSGVRTPYRGRLGYIDNERSPAAYTRSLSAAKMGTNAWPATKTICRVKNPNFDGGRRYRPRKFEYHPTEPSYMFFGTLQGEVVVIYHESVKIVGYVQSILCSAWYSGALLVKQRPKQGTTIASYVLLFSQVFY